MPQTNATIDVGFGEFNEPRHVCMVFLSYNGAVHWVASPALTSTL